MLVLQPRLGPAWRVGDPGEAGVGGRVGLWAKGVAGDANDLVGTLRLSAAAAWWRSASAGAVRADIGGCIAENCRAVPGRSYRLEAFRDGYDPGVRRSGLASPFGGYSRRMSESRGLIGRWRITEMDNWDQEALDLVKPGFIEFDEDGLGELKIPVFVRIFDRLIMSRSGTPRGPLFIGNGFSDSIGDGVTVTKDVQELAYIYCRRRVPVELHIYDGLDHSRAGTPFFAQAQAFLAQRFENVPFQNGCADIGPGNSIAPVPVPPS